MIELRHLRYFIAVAEEQNFNRAAERVHIDQTPLARAVRDLEDQLGVSLLVRTPRRLQLTPAGSELLGHARLLFVRLERAKRAVRSKAQHDRALRIAIAEAIAHPRLTQCLQTWQVAFPDSPLEMIELRADQLVGALRRGEVDVGFCYGAPAHDAIEQRVAWNYPVRAILPAAHVLARRRELSIHELLAYPTVTCDVGSMPGLRQQMDALQRPHACVRLVSEEATSLAGYLTRVAAGFGVGLADAGHLQAFTRTALAVVPLLEEFNFQTFVLYKSRPARAHDGVRRFVGHALAPGSDKEVEATEALGRSRDCIHHTARQAPDAEVAAQGQLAAG